MCPLSASLPEISLFNSLDGGGFETGPVLSRNVSSGEFLMRETGRGVFLVRMMTDSFHYSEAGNVVDVTLKL